MSQVDDKLKAAVVDASFWAAILPIGIAIAPPHVREWVHANKEAFIPLTAWLVMHGYIRGERVKNRRGR